MLRHSTKSRIGLSGYGLFDLWDGWPDEGGVLLERHPFGNLVTRYGHQFYMERSYDEDLHLPVTGMQLGTGTGFAASETGSGAAMQSYISGSSVVLTAGYPISSLVGVSRQIQYVCAWGPGVAQVSGISEISLINQAIATNAAAPASATIARARISPTLNKSAANAVLITTWNQLGGS